MKLRYALPFVAALATSPSLGAAESWVQCPWNGHWYAMTQLALDWQTAQDYARSFGGDLASIASAKENTWILNQFQPAAAVWIGFNDVAVEGTFVWSSGEPVTFVNWNAGEPNNANGGEDFAELMPFGAWNDSDTATLRRAILEVGPMAAEIGSTPGPPTSDEEPPILTPWIQSPTSGLWYARTLVGMTWPEARDYSRKVGGHLATVRSAAENQWILSNFGGSSELWLGFNDEAVEGTFVWDSGEPVTYTNWAAGEPNNVGNEDYASMRTNGPWNDLPITSTLSAVIERVSPAGVTYFGTGCVGTGGFVPEMHWAGSTQGGSTVSLNLVHGLGGAPALWLLAANKGTSSINPFCSLNLGPPIFPGAVGPITLGGAGAGNGSVSLFLPLPIVPANVGFAMQAFVVDPGVPSGYSNTAGMAVVLHP